MEKKNKVILIGVIFTIIAIFIGSLLYKSTKKKEAFEDCEKRAESICVDYGIENIGLDISYSEKYKEYDVYTLTVSGTFNNIPLADIFQVVKSVDSIMVDYEDTILLTRVVLNNKRYKIDSLDENELVCEGETVYRYISEEEISMEISMRDFMKDRLPYEGMSEEYINYTKLGTPKKEYCRDYFKLQERARHITYTWRDSRGNKIAEATVMTWDFEKKKSVDGYIFDLWISNTYKD